MGVMWSDLTSAQQQNAILCVRSVFAAFNGKTRDVKKTMVAIAGAESGYDPRKRGDYYTGMSGSNRTACEAINCGGYCSHGMWQIFIAWHWDKIVASGGPNAKYDACAAAEWIYNPGNAALIARRILDGSGFSAWTVYNNAASGKVPNYLQWTDVAETAMQIVENENGGTEPPIEPPEENGVSIIPFIAGSGILLLLWLFSIR